MNALTRRLLYTAHRSMRSQEVFSRTSPSCRYSATMIRHSAEDLKIRLEILADRHDTRDVAASVAVVGCRPDCDDVLGGEVVFVAFVDQLVGAGDECEVVYVVELGDICQYFRAAALGAEYGLPLMRLCRRRASLRLWARRPMFPRLPDLTRLSHKRHLREESPALVRPRGSDRVF